MNIVIAGDGEVGFHLAQLLSQDQHNITIIDPYSDFIRLMESEFDILAISGDPTSPQVLISAKVKKSDLFISVVHDEKTNILAAMLAKKLGAKSTIARINNTEYLNPENSQKFQEFGIDHMVCPERLAADELVRLLKQNAATEVFDFSEGKLTLFLIKLDERCPIINKTLDDIAASNPNLMFRAVAIHREGFTIIPRGKDCFLPNDLAYVISKPEGIPSLLEFAGKESFEVKNLMIIGGGRIGQKTAQKLEREKNVKLIEIDRDRCEKLSQELNNTLIINGDARDISLLKEEEIRGMDALIALTDDSETNVLTCLLARHLGVKRVIPLIENIEYIDIAQNIGLDTTINKKLITASYIAQYTMNTEVSALKCLHGVDAEVLEYVAKAGSKVTRKLIRNLGIPENSIIGGIIRDGQGLIAYGDFQIMENDKVVVFALPKAIGQLSSFFH